MIKTNIKKMAIAGLFCSVAVVGSLVSFPIFASKCSPIQHMVNILCAVLLGPGYSVLVAFSAALIRNLFGIGTLMAFPGSIFGALLCGVAYNRTKSVLAALLGEMVGTSILGGFCAYPLAILFMGQSTANLAFYIYIIPFFISTAVGAIISGVLIYSLEKRELLKDMRKSVDC